MIASVPPAAVAISFVVVPSNPFREKKSRAVSSNCRRRSLAGNRCVELRESFTSPIVSQYLLTVNRSFIRRGGADALVPAGPPGPALRAKHRVTPTGFPPHPPSPYASGLTVQ